MTSILGISAYYHDSAACLVQDGQIVAAAQEERFTRVKHDQSFPTHAIQFCLDHQGLSGQNIDFVAFYDKPFLKFERILQTYLAFAPLGIRSFIKAMPLWIKRKLWIKDLMRESLDYDGKIIFPEHHESHAASAFYPSPFQKAAFLTMDGVGEWSTTSYGVGQGNEIRMLADIQFPHSLGLLYSAFTYYTGFKVNSGEYKVMGLAPYGEPKYKDLILNELMDLKEDGSFRMNMDYFNYCAGLTMTNKRFDQLLGGPPRRPESKLSQRDMDLARSVQDATEVIVLKMARHIREATQEANLCLAGGVALNCVANGKLLRAGIFDDIWLQPAAGDAGGAIGAALFAWFKYLSHDRSGNGKMDGMAGTYLGPAYDSKEILAFLQERDLPHTEMKIDEIPGRVAAVLAQEKVVGWFQGRMEFGPRALGSRSILGDARSAKMQKIMNLKIKFRESFRPFAPAIKAERVSDYFVLDHDSPYMQLVAQVSPDKQLPMTAQEEALFGLDKLNISRSTVPAITHVDYSARVQTVHQETNPLFHALISRFEQENDCPVLINTSFNVRGEPIVCTPEDAFICFMRTDMDYLVLGNFLLDKTQQKPLEDDVNWQQQFELD